MKSRAYIFIFFLIIIILSIIQADFMKDLNFFGAKPDFLLLFSSFSGFYMVGNFLYPALCGLFAGLCAGAFSDVSASYFIFIYVCSSAAGFFFRDKRFASSSYFIFLLCAAATLFSAVSASLFSLVSDYGNLAYFILNLLPCQLLVNLIFAAPVSGLVRLFTMNTNPYQSFK